MRLISPTPEQDMDKNGHLYVVATPIGNMNDITIRALKVLSEVDFIAAEDTRETGKLLAYHNIKGKLISCHEHNETEKAQDLIEKLKKGASIALVTDAGTPSVSDPGYRIVQTALQNRIQPVPIPGPSAAIAALSVSGLPTDTYKFVGFLSKKKGKRLEQLKKLAIEPGTIIFYESPKRISRLLREMLEVLGDRDAVFAREITKRFEEFHRGRITEIIKEIEQKEVVRGECTLLVSGSMRSDPVCLQDIRKVLAEELKKTGKKPSALAREMAEEYGLPRKTIYQEILEMKDRCLPETKK
ncbi:MAG: 16S rRNA (cytidine(1402)-2'-O)-methyltransferase [Desulfobacterales bacterium]